jgi:hypothetical protein
LRVSTWRHDETHRERFEIKGVLLGLGNPETNAAATPALRSTASSI